jgi:cobalt-zinc-cadmium efflux system membrane fusion protein
MRIPLIGLLSLITACMGTVFPTVAWAHGGEDHGGESLAATSSTLGGQIVVPVETQILVGIKTAPVIRETLPKTLKALGRTLLHPESEAVITSPVEGRLVTTGDYTPPTLGQRVIKGQPLAMVEQTISAPETIAIGSERALIQSELRQANADLDFAEKEYERVGKLKGIVPDKEILKASNALAVARAKREGLTKQASVYDSSSAATMPQATNPRLVLLHSPIDGVIAQTHVTLGEYVRPEKQLYHVVDLTEVLLEAEIFENDIAAIAHASGAKVIVEAYPGETFDARFISIGTSVDPLTRTLHVLFSVPNPDGKLVAEMFADVSIETGEKTEGITVPKSAIVMQEGQPVVYLKTSGEQFVSSPVTVIRKVGDRVMLAEAESSLVKEGGRVVVQGTYQVRMSAVRGPVISDLPPQTPAQQAPKAAAAIPLKEN